MQEQIIPVHGNVSSNDEKSYLLSNDDVLKLTKEPEYEATYNLANNEKIFARLDFDVKNLLSFFPIPEDAKKLLYAGTLIATFLIKLKKVNRQKAKLICLRNTIIPLLLCDSTSNISEIIQNTTKININQVSSDDKHEYGKLLSELKRECIRFVNDPKMKSLIFGLLRLQRNDEKDFINCIAARINTVFDMELRKVNLGLAYGFQENTIIVSGVQNTSNNSYCLAIQPDNSTIRYCEAINGFRSEIRGR